MLSSLRNPFAISRQVLFAALLVGPIPTAWSDVTVGLPGDGADFTDLAAAVASASVGENVLVLPGSYAAGFTIHSGVQLIGSGSDQTFLVAPGAARHLTVAGVPAGESVHVVGFGLQGTSEFGSGLALENNLGAVGLADVVYTPSTASSGLFSTGAEELLSVDDSNQVLLEKVVLDATGLEDTQTQGTYALNSEGSVLFATDCRFLGGGSNGINGRDGVRVLSTELWLTATEISGADGAFLVSDDPGAEAPAGGAGVLAFNSSRVEFFGGLGQVIQGGDGGGVFDSGGSPQTPGDGGSGLRLFGSSTAVLSGGVLEGGDSPVGGAAPPFVTDPSSTLFFAFEPSVSLVTSKALVQPGETITLEIAGLSGTSVGVFFGLDLISPVPLPGFAGLLQTQPLPPFPLLTIQLNPFGGTVTETLEIPSFLPPGFRAYLQGAVLGFSISSSISMPALLQVGP